MGYERRHPTLLSPLATELSTHGIAVIRDLYSVNDLAEINRAMTPLFRARQAEPRAYVRPHEMHDIGILDRVLCPAMRDVILSVVPDPVLFHFHAYEIAGNSNQSHIFADTFSGWHRDPDSAYFPGDPTHVSIFVYLSDVGASDGSFEFSTQQPSERLRSDSPAVSMLGQAGFSFVWHRSFYHRAAPNRGKQRRRVLKISIQRNQFHSHHLSNDFFATLVAKLPKGDAFTDLLFGRYQAREAPRLSPAASVRPQRVAAAQYVGVPDDILTGLAKREQAEAGTIAAYD